MVTGLDTVDRLFTGEVVPATDCTVEFETGIAGLLFIDAPTGISHRWPGWPCAGLRPAAELISGATGRLIAFEGDG